MHTFYKTLILFAILAVSACSSVSKDIQIDTQADPKVNFEGYESYAWMASSEVLYDPEGQWEPRDMDIDAEVRFEIDAQLRERGMIESQDGPDMYVVFGAGVDMAALGLKVDPKTKEEMLVNIPQAALVVGLIDADTGFLIWQGVAEGEAVANRSLEETRERIHYAVKKMFKQIP